MTIAVIIPVWNDADALRAALASVRAGACSTVLECGGLPPLSSEIESRVRCKSDGKPPHSKAETEDPNLVVEVAVVDAGSQDGSADVARAADAHVVASPVRNRAAQLNLGARASEADVLLFLHADTLLPHGWREAVVRALTKNPRVVGGAFRRRFVPGSWFLRATCALADVRGRWWGWFLGDQAMFVRRPVFEKLAGFAPLRACEDLDFSRRLARVGRTVLLSAMVQSSDRRFRARGAFRQTCADMMTTWRFLRARDSFLENEPEPSQR